tara:strand:- start:110 stop:928 length:819 start_codon:yes stop_codon:yes gene_type:complete
MTLPVASVVTQKTLTEFELLKYSIELFHECDWVISCDHYVNAALQNIPNVTCLRLIESDDCDHNIQDEIKQQNWMKVMMTKFDAVSAHLEKHGNCLFLDSDMLFVGPIEDSLMELFLNKNIDATISQHMTNNWPVEAKHGLFNAGMFHIRSKEFLSSWISLSRDYKKYNFYFEQQPLEFVQRNFVSLNFPINYNIGWWRFNTTHTRERLNNLQLINDDIHFGLRPAVNFHVHTSRDLEYDNFGQFLVDKITDLFRQSSNPHYKSLLEFLEGQ